MQKQGENGSQKKVWSRKKKRKGIEENHLLDAQVGSENREKRLRMSKEKLLRELQESVEIEVPDIGVPHQSVEPQVEEVVVEKTSAGQKWRRQGTS